MSLPLDDLIERIDALERRLDPPKFMTTQQAADFIGVSLRQFHEWRRIGDAPAAIHCTQRFIRYDRDDVIAWMHARRVSA